jgi:SAM-dependent methyltransferase
MATVAQDSVDGVASRRDRGRNALEARDGGEGILRHRTVWHLGSVRGSPARCVGSLHAMDESQRRKFGRSYGTVAEVYDRTRPDYPTEAVDWLVGKGQRRILELGAGTGKLTRTLLSRGHGVCATDPLGPMLRHLMRNIDGPVAVQAVAEGLPFRDMSFDVVVVAQAFHWFDHEKAVPEIARVLRPYGTLAMVWNERDDSVPWVRRLSRLLGEIREDYDVRDDAVNVPELGPFTPVEEKTFRFWQIVDKERLLGDVSSRSYVAVMEPADRDPLLERVGALYDEYGRGADGMRMPYLTRCFRTERLGETRQRAEPPGGGNLLFDYR